MSANPYKPHILVLPEDDANRDIVNGFFLEIPSQNQRAFQVLANGGGWIKAVERVCNGDCEGLRSNPMRHLILIIDMDDRSKRLQEVQAKIPKDIQERVYVIGAKTTPEKLRADLGSFENIGQRIASDCRLNEETTWSHPLLQHNASELRRLRALTPLLFI